MSDNRKKAGLALGVFGALAIGANWIFNLTGFATNVATLADNARVIAFCNAVGLRRYCGGTGAVGQTGTTATSTTTPPLPAPVSVAIEAKGASDSLWAAKLNSDLGAALASASGGGGEGYRIEGLVSEAAITPSHHVRLSFGWSIAKGSVVMPCGVRPIAFPGRIPGKLVTDVAGLIAPALSNSIRYGDVRCS
jgi:hypothetical protein